MGSWACSAVAPRADRAASPNRLTSAKKATHSLDKTAKAQLCVPVTPVNDECPTVSRGFFPDLVKGGDGVRVQGVSVHGKGRQLTGHTLLGGRLHVEWGQNALLPTKGKQVRARRVASRGSCREQPAVLAGAPTRRGTTGAAYSHGPRSEALGG